MTGLKRKTKEKINELLDKKFKNKVKNFKLLKRTDMNVLSRTVIPEEHRRIAMIVQSWYTTFGMAIYEQCAEIIAETSGKKCSLKYQTPLQISKDRIDKIEEIMRRKGTPDIDKEINEILAIKNKNLKNSTNNQIVDFYLESNGKVYLFDLKTVTLNKNDWINYKRVMLRWVARMDKKVIAALAFPYNPYFPEKYDVADKFQKQYMQINKNVFVGEQFWDEIGGKGCYEDLCECLENMGKYYSQIINRVNSEEGLSI